MDEKDRIIVQLKSELRSSKSNERDYADLNFLLSNLENRYNLLNVEKYRIEQEFITRNEETTLKHRSDIDQIKAELQYSTLHSDKIREILEERQYQNQGLIEDNKHLQNELVQLVQENKALNSKVEYLQNQIFQLSDRKHKQDQEIMTTLQDNNQFQHMLESMKNELFELKNYKESSQEESKALLTKNAKLQQEVYQSEKLLKSQSYQIKQYSNKHQEDEYGINEEAGIQLNKQKQINSQLFQNNEHFQTKIDTLEEEKLKLYHSVEQLKFQKLQQPTLNESDINRQQIQEVLKEAAYLQIQADDMNQINYELQSENSILQQKLELNEDLVIQIKRENQLLKQGQCDKDQRIFELEREKKIERDTTTLHQQKLSKQHSSEALHFHSQQEDEYTQLKQTFEALERECQMLLKINQSEISKVHDLQFQLTCKDKELNKTITRLQEQEACIRSMLKDVEENEGLKQKLLSQKKQIKKFVAEGHLIKEYLKRKKVLRDSRIDNEQQVQQSLDELYNSKLNDQ